MNDGAASTAEPPLVLHAGCGRAPLPEWLSQYREVRLDVDPSHRPDMLASMTDLGEIGPFNAVLCCHSLGHLHPDDVDRALREFHRVLSPGGMAIVIVPDLEGVRPTEEVLYVSPAGPVTGLDMIYGMRSLSQSHPAMIHRTGFIASTLRAAMERAGFDVVKCDRGGGYNLVAIGGKV